jgi:hypothetical protein
MYRIIANNDQTERGACNVLLNTLTHFFAHMVERGLVEKRKSRGLLRTSEQNDKLYDYRINV